MEVLNYEIDLTAILPFELHTFDSERCFLWVLYADKIPPHVGISSNNCYFSLKYNGKDEYLHVDNVLKRLEQKKIKTLLFELTETISAGSIAEHFSAYSKTKTGHITCLHPVKETLHCNNVQTLKELLSALNNAQWIGSVKGINIDDTFQGIIDYSLQDIHDRLRHLEDA